MSHNTLFLPHRDGTVREYTLRKAAEWPKSSGPFRSRALYSAVHVVPDPLADTDPVNEPRIDWETTLAYRRHIWSLGLGIAEAMDTAQRGMGLDWEVSKELIRRTLREARAAGGDIVCGAGTDHLAPLPERSLDEVEAAYEEQVGYVEGEGGRVVLMASRALAACARTPDDYARVYGKILSQVSRPVILHWLGDMFDPALAGYWGHRDLDDAMRVCLDIVKAHADKVDGIKVSLLDAEKEVAMRRQLPEGVRMYTGDDFNYPDLIRGDEHGYSDALLGIFDAIAPAAASAVGALDAGDTDRYEQIFAPTVPLARHIFQKPTYFYKTGIVFMAYLNGHQTHFRVVGGHEGARSILHLSELFVLADQAGLLSDPGLAVTRMRLVLELAGVNQ